MDDMRPAYDELYAYTMQRAGPSFVLQHVVDAWAAQNADADAKPIAITFALVGLYLHVEKHFSGKQVQQAHMRLARQKKDWPVILLPQERGKMTAADVLAAPEGTARDAAIDAWCRSVWDAFRDSRATIIELLRPYDLA